MGLCSSSPNMSLVDEGQIIQSVTGKKKALLVGINYVGTSSELRGCINDVMNQKQVLMQHYQFKEENIVVLTEEGGHDPPTKSRILQGFKDLFSNAMNGDLLFFQYSGHGSQCSLWNGMADCICPLDCMSGSWPGAVILDTEIHKYFYDPLPSGCKVVALFDCCHSGTVANLPVQRDITGRNSKPRYMTPPQDLKIVENTPVGGIRKGVISERYAGHLLWVFSGCQDHQTSADAFINNVPQGAFTWAFIKALKDDVWNETYIDLLHQIKMNLRSGQFSQVPALTTTHSSYLNSWYCGRVPSTRDIVPEKTGRKKALLVGINYRQTRNELRGCINDVLNQKSMLKDAYGYTEPEILMLTEDGDKKDWPYKARILEGLKWLVEDAKEGDALFFQYSGHGSQMTDRTGREPSGLSDCICPLDCDKPWPAHIILDTEIHSFVYDKVPNGVRLTCVFDCCHSGTVANLEVKRDIQAYAMAPQVYQGSRWMHPPKDVSLPSTGGTAMGGLSCAGKNQQMQHEVSGFRHVLQDKGYASKLVWVYSGCQDDQTSADAFEENQYQGAFTWAFLKALREHRCSMHHSELLNAIRGILRRNYAQIPALTTTTRENYLRFYLGQRRPFVMRKSACF